jgi:hypothetical protein
MSYSFQIRASTKTAAKAAVAIKFDEVIGYQKCHERDKAQALAAANAFIDLLPDVEEKHVGVNMAGSLCGKWDGTDVVHIESANVGVTAYLVDRAAA